MRVIFERHRSGQITANTIGRFSKETEFRAAQCGDPFRQRGDLCCLGMLLRKIAQQYRNTFAACQTLGDCGCRAAHFDALHGFIRCCLFFRSYNQRLGHRLWMA